MPPVFLLVAHGFHGGAAASLGIGDRLARYDRGRTIVGAFQNCNTTLEPSEFCAHVGVFALKDHQPFLEPFNSAHFWVVFHPGIISPGMDFDMFIQSVWKLIVAAYGYDLLS